MRSPRPLASRRVSLRPVDPAASPGRPVEPPAVPRRLLQCVPGGARRGSIHCLVAIIGLGLVQRSDLLALGSFALPYCSNKSPLANHCKLTGWEQQAKVHLSTELLCQAQYVESGFGGAGLGCAEHVGAFHLEPQKETPSQSKKPGFSKV